MPPPRPRRHRDTGFVTCATGAAVSSRSADLADGRYRPRGALVVTPRPRRHGRRPEPIVGLVEAHAFTVDTVAPARPSILTPGQRAERSAPARGSRSTREEFARSSAAGTARRLRRPARRATTRTFTHERQPHAGDPGGRPRGQRLADVRSRGPSRPAAMIEAVTDHQRPRGRLPEPPTRCSSSTPTRWTWSSPAASTTGRSPPATRRRRTPTSPTAPTPSRCRAATRFGNVSELASHRFVVDRSAPVAHDAGLRPERRHRAGRQHRASGPNEGALTLTCSLDGWPGRSRAARRSTSPASRSVSTRWSSPPRTPPATSAR